MGVNQTSLAARIAASIKSSQTQNFADADESIDFYANNMASDIGTEVDAAFSSSSSPVIILAKTASASQNVGGANGTEVFWTWDSQLRVDTGYTHSTSVNPSRITIVEAGWYELKFIGAAQQGGGQRTTLQGIWRLDGGTTQRRGTIRNYSRGSAYGNMSAGLMCTIQVTAGQYLEVGTRVEHTNGVYITNTSGAEINDEEHFFQLRKLD